MVGGFGVWCGRGANAGGSGAAVPVGVVAFLFSQDGEARVLGRGEVLLAEDIDTTGHTTRTVGGPADLLFVAMGVTEP